MNNYDLNVPQFKEDSPTPIVVKKGGIFGKILCLFLGFVLGAVGTVGGVAAALYYTPAQDVASVAKIDLTQYVSEEYAKETVFGLLMGVSTAVINISTGDGTLNDLNAISPKVSPIVEKLSQRMKDSYGLNVNHENMMDVPFSGLMQYIEDSIYDSYLYEVLDKSTDITMNATVLSMCYGEQYVDFIQLPDGTIEMLNGAEPRKIKDLENIGSDLIYDLHLADVMDLDYNDKMMMYLAYGREGVHYTYNYETQEVTMLQERIAIDGAGVIYNEYAEVVGGTIDGTTYTTQTGESYIIVDAPALPALKTEGGLATQYYLNNMDGTPYLYPRMTVGDLTRNESLIDKMTSRLTVKEILGEDQIVNDQFLKHLGDETVDSLPEKLKELTIQQVMPEDVFVNDGNGNFFDKNGNITTNEDEYVVKRMWWYLLHDEATCSAEHTDCDGSCIGQYKLSAMELLVNNMSTNMQAATLNQLDEDEMMEMDPETLNTDIVTNIAGVPIPGMERFEGKSKLGELTATEILDYTSIYIQAADNALNP